MGGINKLLEPLDGIPVLVRTLTALERAQRVDSIRHRHPGGGPHHRLPAVQDLRHHQVQKGDPGREDREHSVLLAALEAEPDTELLAVQDGARPLVSRL